MTYNSYHTMFYKCWNSTKKHILEYSIKGKKGFHFWEVNKAFSNAYSITNSYVCMFILIVLINSLFLSVLQWLTCDQWGRLRPTGGSNSTPSRESWSDSSGLNSSLPLSAGPLRLCRIEEKDMKVKLEEKRSPTLRMQTKTNLLIALRE